LNCDKTVTFVTAEAAWVDVNSAKTTNKASFFFMKSLSINFDKGSHYWNPRCPTPERHPSAKLVTVGKYGIWLIICK
jgi:hypothetical protein